MSEQYDYWDIIHQTDAEFKRIGWSIQDAKNYLEFAYGAKSRALKLNKRLHGHSIQLVRIFKALLRNALSPVLIHLYAESSAISMD